MAAGRGRHSRPYLRGRSRDIRKITLTTLSHAYMGEGTEVRVATEYPPHAAAFTSRLPTAIPLTTENRSLPSETLP
jgi:hypothetical protein